MRAKSEPTQMECRASFLGKLLVLPANVRLDFKDIARYKHSSLLGLVVSDEGKKFKTLTTDVPLVQRDPAEQDLSQGPAYGLVQLQSYPHVEHWVPDGSSQLPDRRQANAGKCP